MNKLDRTIVINMAPENRFYDDISGASGCANCSLEVHPGNDLLYCQGSRIISIPIPYREFEHVIKEGDKIVGCSNPSPKKRQTIRDKPFEVGQKIAIWEKKRGMRKGHYCSDCLSSDIIIDRPIQVCARCNSDEIIYLPRKILETRVKECIPIFMQYSPEVLNIKIPSLKSSIDVVHSTSLLSKIAQLDGFKSNFGFIEFFLKDPRLKRGEIVTKYIIRW